MGSSPFARTERGRGNSHGLFQCELRDSMSPLTPLSLRDISPGRIHVSDVWSLALAQKGGKLPRPLFARASGLAAFIPLCHWRDFSPGRIYVPDVWSLAHSQNSRKLPRPLFSASFGRTHIEDGGSLPPGHATRIPLIISTLGIFRVVKTTTLISVKQLIHSNLQVALQLRRHWRTFHGQMCRTAKSTSKRNRGDAYLPYCRRYRKSGTEINRPTIYGSCHGGYVHPDFYEPFSILEAIRYHITFIVNLFQGCFRSAIDLEFKHID